MLGACSADEGVVSGYIRKAALSVSMELFANGTSRLTRNDVTRVHSVLVLDEAKTVHELDLSDLAGAMGLEVALDFRLGGIAGKVAQIQACR